MLYGRIFNISNCRNLSFAFPKRYFQHHRTIWSKCSKTLPNKNNDSSLYVILRHFAVQPPKRPSRLATLAPVNWMTFAFSLAFGGILLGYMFYLEQKKSYEDEKQRKLTIGRSLIGGPWELVNADGKLMTEKDFFGKWVLIYFGFTHCPDICPDELEKMAVVIEKLHKEKSLASEVVGLFFTVDPERDTPDRIKRYVEEFSPLMIGFTGSREQVNKVCKTFRVYHSAGPKDVMSDYIVDHTIITYLMDPEGNFVDYFGQKRTADEIIGSLQLSDAKYYSQKRKEKFFEKKEEKAEGGT